ncbi:kinesin-like protein KIFC1 isoform X2 [Rana temporaria]|uniref:kinesin-like protein KIFC1 isoform X2 n=1 Tax=Rana temporaria TaxID=8407 RepID=UPI001AAD3C3F|nr:kinesin-like protein KIFC1 isoform X2 [Rana temporaria]
METSLPKKQPPSLKMSRLPVPPNRKRQLCDENQEPMSRKRPRTLSPEAGPSKVRVAASIATTRPYVAPALPKPQVIGRQSVAVMHSRNRANLSATAAPAIPRVTVSAPAQTAGAKKRAAWDLKGQINDMRDQVTSYKGKVQSLSGENARLASTNEQLAKQVATLSNCNTDLSQQLRTVESKLESLEREAQRLTGLCQRQEKELANEKHAVQELQETSHNITEQLNHKEQKLICLEGEHSTLKALATDQSAQISSLTRTVEERDTQVYALETERRRLHNTVQELKGNIRVFCRVRPILPSEKALPAGNITFCPNDEKAIVLTKVEESHIGRDRSQSVKYDFNFDCVFPPTTGQAPVFEEISLLVQSALDGYQVCIFAYGQTGSGKTYTMEGPDDLSAETMGVIPRAIQQIFSSAEELKKKGWQYKFTASFLEIYNETIKDLLVNRPDKKHEYEIRKVNITSNEVYVTNLHYVEVSSVEEVHDLLHAAKTHRAVAKTALNDRSSRSHSVFQLKIEGENKLRDVHTSSVLSLIDLAGSERLDRSLSTGDRLKETQSINTSLSALGMVIASLCNKESHIPYRNSKLTYLLQNSLGGNSKVLMFVNISALDENFAESLNSLRFASKVNECVIGTARANRK